MTESIFTNCSSRKELVTYLKGGGANSSPKQFIVHNLKGHALWVVWGENGINTLVCYLIIHEGGKWGFKTYIERDGIPYYTVPPRTLSVADETNPEWRGKVREYRLNKNKWKQGIRDLLKEGKTVRVHFISGCNIPHVIAETPYPLNGRYEEDGKLYRIPPALVGRLEVIENAKEKNNPTET